MIGVFKRIWNSAGRRLLRGKRYLLTLVLARLAHRLRPTPETHRALARAYLNLEKQEYPLAHIEAALEADPDNPDLLKLRALYWRRRAHPNRALRDLKRVMELRPEDTDVPEIVREMGERTALNPVRARAFLEVGVAEYREGNMDEALSYLERSHQAEKGWRNTFWLAKACLRSGRTDRGMELLRQSREMNPEEKSVNVILARQHVLRGEYDFAHRELDAMGEIPPFHAEQVEQIHDRIERERLFFTWEPQSPFAGLPRPEYAPGPGVCFVLGNGLPMHLSGYTVRSHYILRQLAFQGAEPVPVIRPGYVPDPVNPVRMEADGIGYHFLADATEQGALSRNSVEYVLRYAQMLLDFVKGRPVRLMQGFSNYINGIPASMVARYLGLPFAYEVRGLWEESNVVRGTETTDSVRYQANKRLEEHCMREADVVTTIAETMKQDFVERGIPAEKIRIVPNAVDTEVFSPRPQNAELARSLGIEGMPTVGYVGSFVAYEGLEVLVEAFEKVARSMDRARLLLVGDGERFAALQAQVEESGLGDRVLMTGRVPHAQIFDYYSLIDVVVNPRLDRRVCRIVTPLKPFEAMSLAKAVVLSDLPALREIVTDGETGLLFAPEDPDDLAARLLELLGRPDLCESLGTQGRKWVQAHRTWEAVCATYLDIYRELAG